MLLTEQVNSLKHGNNLQNEQGDAKPADFHMESYTKYGKMKSWSWQSQISTESRSIGRSVYKISSFFVSDLFHSPVIPAKAGIQIHLLILSFLNGGRKTIPSLKIRRWKLESSNLLISLSNYLRNYNLLHLT